jgi:hypothetical protein
MEYDEKGAWEALTNPQHKDYQASQKPGPVRDAIMKAFETARPGPFVSDWGQLGPQFSDEKMGYQAPPTPGSTPPEVTQPATQPQMQPETPVTQPTEQPATVQSYSPLWDTPEAEALTSYKAVYGENYEQAAVVDVKAIVDGFVEEYVGRQGTPEAKAHVVEYLDQFMRRMGNHPLNAQFLRYVGHRLSYFSK